MSKKFGKTTFSLVMTSAVASLSVCAAAQAGGSNIVSVPPEKRATAVKMAMPEQSMSRTQAELSGNAAGQQIKDAAGKVHYIVIFADGASQPYLNKTDPDPRFPESHDPKVLQLLRETEQVHQIKATHLYSQTIQGFAAFLTPQQVQQLRSDRRIKTLSPDVQGDFSAGGVWEDVRVGNATLPWGVQAVGGGKAATVDSAVAIYVVDSGVGYHPDLNVVNRWATNPACLTGTYKHGTFVAGIAGAINNNTGVTGVDAGANIVSLSYGDNSCVANSQSTANIIAAMEEVKRQIQARGRVGVVNFSTNFPINSRVGFKESIRSLIAPNPATGYPGAFFVQSAGNQHADACLHSFNDNLPADGAMVVGAIDHNGQPVQRLNGSDAFNNIARKFKPEPGSNYGACVDAWAPGKNVMSTWMVGNTASYLQGDGTSFAAPHVAGVAAYLIRTNPSLRTPAEVETAVRARLVNGGATSGGLPVLTASVNGSGFAAQPTVEFSVNGGASSPAPDVLGQAPLPLIYSDNRITLSFDSVGAQNCDVKGYVNGSLWYHAPNVGTSYNWGGAIVLNPGLYRWEAICKGANGKVGTAVASARITAVPPRATANFIVNGVATAPNETRTISTSQAFTLGFNSTNTTYCYLRARLWDEAQGREVDWYTVDRMPISYDWGNVRLDPGRYLWTIKCTNEDFINSAFPTASASFRMNVVK